MAARIVPEGGWQNRLKPAKTPRVKNRKHLDWIKTLPCICCLVEGLEIQADDPMHIRGGSPAHGKEPAGGAQTSDDRWTLPGCRRHHDLQHSGSEAEFWRSFGVDHFLLALVLWGLTGDDHAARLVLQHHGVAGRAARIMGQEERRRTSI